MVGKSNPKTVIKATDDALVLYEDVAEDSIEEDTLFQEGDAELEPTSKIVRLGSVMGLLGSMLLLIVLPLLTLKKSLLSFRWYALGAVWIGITVGMLLGAGSLEQLISTIFPQQHSGTIAVIEKAR